MLWTIPLILFGQVVFNPPHLHFDFYILTAINNGSAVLCSQCHGSNNTSNPLKINFSYSNLSTLMFCNSQVLKCFQMWNEMRWSPPTVALGFILPHSVGSFKQYWITTLPLQTGPIGIFPLYCF